MKTKKVLAMAFAIVCLLPAAAMTSPSAATPQDAETAALSLRLEPAAAATVIVPGEGSVSDEELLQISGQSYYGLLPWQGLVPEMETVSRIKLWDEANRVPSQPGISRLPGSFCSGSLLPLLAIKP